MRNLTPGARTGLETATVVVNAGNGYSAAVKPRDAVILKLVTCWYLRRIKSYEAAAVGTACWPRSLSGVRQTLNDL